MGRPSVVLALVLAVIVAPAGAAGAKGASPGDVDTAPTVRADFDADDADDVAVGVPGESVGTIPGPGAVDVLYGSVGGLSGAGSQLFHQDVPGVFSAAEELDELGWSLAVGDVRGDGPEDLVVGVPFESVGTVGAAGAVNVFEGGVAGFTGGVVLYQDVAGIASTAEPFDNFGYAVAAPGL